MPTMAWSTGTKGTGIGLGMPLVKQVIRSVKYEFAKSVAEHALKLQTAKEVETYLLQNLRQVAPELVE